MSKTGCTLHADVIMTTHVHLLLTPGDAQAVLRMLVFLGRRYVPYVNASYQRPGSLQPGARWHVRRPRALPVEQLPRQ